MDFADLVPACGAVNKLGPPLLHFVLLGAALFLVQSLLPARETIALGGEEVQRLRQDWQRDTGRPPSEAQLIASLERRLDEEILLREALRLRLDERDPIARRRLVQNLRFAFPDTLSDDAALLRQAQQLGMNRRDTVVRQRLVELMRQRIESRAQAGEAAIAAQIAQHPERYTNPARIGYTQIFFSRDRRGATTAADAEAALAQLRAAPGAAPTGDPFLLGNRFPADSRAEIASRFGEHFASAVAQAAPGAWFGPVASPYGLHLVRIDSYEAAQPAEPAALHSRAAYAALAEQEQLSLRAALLALRQRYRIQLPEPGA